MFCSTQNPHNQTTSIPSTFCVAPFPAVPALLSSLPFLRLHQLFFYRLQFFPRFFATCVFISLHDLYYSLILALLVFLLRLLSILLSYSIAALAVCLSWLSFLSWLMRCNFRCTEHCISLLLLKIWLFTCWHRKKLAYLMLCSLFPFQKKRNIR